MAEKKTTAKKTAETVKAAPAKAKTAAKTAGEKIAQGVKAPVAKARAAKLEIVIQSPMGGNITADEIAAKLPKDAKSVYVRVDQNKLWWINGDETGSVDIW